MQCVLAMVCVRPLLREAKTVGVRREVFRLAEDGVCAFVARREDLNEL